MERLVKEQHDIGTTIQQVIANCKKAPVDRRTITFYQGKIQELETLWNKFNRNDGVIRKTSGVDETHVYFTDDFYGAISMKFNDARDNFLEILSSLQKGQSQEATDDLPSTSKSIPMPNQSEEQKLQTLINIVKRMITQVLEFSNDSMQFYIVKLKTIEQHWKNCNMLHERLWVTNANYNVDAYIQNEDQINDGLVAINEHINQLQQQIAPVDVTSNLNLPKITLPKFDGNYLNWRNFYDLFAELVHKKQIPLCQKMLYLKSSVIGEAEGLIQHFASTAANYNDAWKMLIDRYENKRVLVNSLLNKLLSQGSSTNEAIASLKTLHDTTQECLRSLENLNISTADWDPLLLHILVQKLHKNTHTLWEQSISNPHELPTLQQFLNFIRTRFQSLEALGPKQNAMSHTQSSVRSLGAVLPNSNRCNLCQDQHQLYSCPTFLKLSSKERLSTIQKLKHCVNCLKSGHSSSQCKSSSCRKCTKKHNTLLHLDAKNQPQKTTPSPPIKETMVAASLSSTKAVSQHSSVILSTVVVFLTDTNGKKHKCRGLLDSGSQVNLITKRCANKLKLKNTPRVLGIQGIGQTISKSSERANVELSSTLNNFNTRIDVYVLQKIVSDQPNININIDKWNLPSNVQLADPTFNESGPIDILIGAGVFFTTLCIGQITLGNDLPLLQNTLFGWVVGGAMSDNGQMTTTYCGIGIEDDQLNTNLERFWQLEDRESNIPHLTAAERRCEKHYVQNIQRHIDGRFIVKLPFESGTNELGDSKNIALHRFMAVEKKLQRDPKLHPEYVKFMREYENLNHMKEVDPRKLKEPYYFLPHHAVIKADSTTTKLRVVFDASAKTSTNVSLNDILSSGPTIQSDVFSILIRFRLPRFAFAADIEKMYRQIWVHEDDQCFQLIWWREDPTKPLRCMQLTTVTYGTTCAPFLAIRCLQQLAHTKDREFPLAAEAIKSNFYVDDVLSGSDSMIKALDIQAQLRKLLNSAGFNLRKWCANEPRLLATIPYNDREIDMDITGHNEDHVKTMGLKWQPKPDVFSIRTNQKESQKITKRTILAGISRLFDPLGIVAPVVVTAKILLQELWKLKLDWDAAVPQSFHTFWLKFSTNLHKLEELKIERHIFNHHIPVSSQIHIFADASEKAFGAAVYIRSMTADNTVIVRLLCSKSRVAPVKQVTVPRLELCAAKLAVELAVRLKDDNILCNSEVYYWSDSMIVLGWLNASSSNYHTFVANRISYIQQHSNVNQWHHVRSENNPADLLSRGVMPENLHTSTLWFYGPLFLHGNITSWPMQPPKTITTHELRPHKQVSSTAVITSDFNIFEAIDHRNSLLRLQRILAYVNRFINSAKHQGRPKDSILSAEELDKALLQLVKFCQQTDFTTDIKQLQKDKHLTGSSNISSLAPFLDDNGILRVGGRIQESDLPYDAKHPMLLSYHHPLTKLIFTHMHCDNLHVGPQTLLSIVRQRFWPLNGKNVARATVKGCVRCVRARPVLFDQMMGNLPKDRVQPARPFINAGVDFFGPLWISFKLRGKRPIKAYVAVFCCFSTKATHLELVTDLTTEAFIGALQRFTARRGHCSRLYCDNATNFVGASNLLKEVQDVIYTNAATEKIKSECAKRNIDFIFIPPRAPHFGGLWEAAVKSAKHLMQSTLMSAKLTHEEMTTLLAQAEAILNSRPLTPMSTCPNDLSVLTPGHFLIGEPLTTVIDPHAAETKLKLLDRWKLVSQLKENFWKRWSLEYLHQLQNRCKWKTAKQDIKPGMLVLIKEDNLPPCQWSLGRITAVIRGEDDLIRVVDVKTPTKIIRRPIVKLAPLPVEQATEVNIAESQTNPTPTHEASKAKARDVHVQGVKRPKLSNITTTLLMICLLIPLCVATKIQPFSTNPGLYFERLGSAGFITSEWNIVSYVNMTNYWKWCGKVKDYPAMLTQMCNTSKSATCATSVSLIQHLVDELETNNILLHKNAKRRIHRGAFNIVGNIAHSLFGVLDENYAADTAGTITTIQQDENKLQEQLRMQRSFLDHTLNVMKKDHRSIEQEFQNIEHRLQKATNQINVLKQEERTTMFNDLTLQTVLILLYLQRIQDSTLEIMIDSHHGKINPEILSPIQLEDELIKIKTNIPNTVKLPECSSLLKYYNIMTVEARMDDFLIVNIKLPLIRSDEFEILKVTPVPWVKNHLFYAINSTHNVIIINMHRDQYYALNDDSLRHCVLVEDDYYLCHPTQALNIVGSEVARCEINILNQATSNNTCTTRQVMAGPHWIQLHTPNAWIYSIDGTRTLNTVCNNTLNQLTLNQSGVLRLHETCIIKHPFIAIQGQRVYQGPAIRAYIPDIDIKQAMTERATTMSEEYIKSYNSLIKNLDRMPESTELEDHVNYHHIHHYSLIYICFGLIIIGGVVAFKFYRRSAKPQPTSVPANSDADSTIIGIHGYAS